MKCVQSNKLDFSGQNIYVGITRVRDKFCSKERELV